MIMTLKQAGIALLLGLAGAAASAQTAVDTIRICDDTGCSDRPKTSATFDPNAQTPEEQAEGARIAALEAMAKKDARAAYDLGLRYFRGDGIKRDSYLAIKWMREAAERGNAGAQMALGRFYLMGLEEMGPDAQEAEKWLTLVAGRGGKDAAEAQKLLAQAQANKKDEQAAYKWREQYRNNWYRGWWGHYPYLLYWRAGVWYYY